MIMYQNLIGKRVIYVEVRGYNYIFPNTKSLNECIRYNDWRDGEIEVSDYGEIIRIDERNDFPALVVVDTDRNGICELKEYGLEDFM